MIDSAFAQSLIPTFALPVLAKGYTDLVATLRRNKPLAKLVAAIGLANVLDSDSPDLAGLRKKNKEVVTGQEKEAERLMAEAVKARYPAHAIVGEEHGYKQGSATRWVFDPIDGTSAMIRTAMAEAYGVPIGSPPPSFGITVGVTEGEDAVLGIVTELRPANGTLIAVKTWVGMTGQPTTCNGSIVQPPQVPATLADATLAATVPEIMFSNPEKWSGYQALLDSTQKPCVTDQNCIGFMRLLETESAISIAYEADLAYHDAAALIPLLQGAGLVVTDDKGHALRFPESAIPQEFRILAAAPPLHRLALARVQTGVPLAENRFKFGERIHQGYAQKFPLHTTST